MTTKTKQTTKPTNGIITIDGQHYMLCGNAKIPIKIVAGTRPVDKQPVKVDET